MAKKSTGPQTALQLSSTELQNTITQLQTTMKATAQKAVADHLKAFFDAHPEVAALRWTQYTPYFNDGDECVFRVHDIAFLSKEPDDMEEGDDESEETNFNGYDTAATKILGNYAGLKEDMEAIKDTFSAIEPQMKDVFGDHVRVYINREGSQTFEYEHD